MSVLLDIILAFILAVCTFIGYKHGLIRTLSKFISYIVAFTLANNFYVVVAKLLIKIPLLSNMLYGEAFAEKMTYLDRFDLLFDRITETLFVVGDEATMAAARSASTAAALASASAAAVSAAALASSSSATLASAAATAAVSSAA
jgi:hypothetical protein